LRPHQGSWGVARGHLIPPPAQDLGELVIKLDNRRLREVPVAVLRKERVQRLSLCRNLLTALPPAIASLSQLVSLQLHGNGLAELPVELAALTRLTELRLGSNRLNAVPPQLASLPHLQVSSFGV